jgi:O-antigen/teichoic acid export membrane protein
MQERFSRFFTGDVSLLVLSGMAAQAVNLASYPFLTQSYSPASFGTFSVISALVTFAGATILLRFDAIIQIVDPVDDYAILGAAVVTGFSLSLAGMAVLLVFGEWLFALFGDEAGWHRGYALILPILALMNGLFALSRQYFAKNRRYRRSSVANFLRTLTMVATQLGLVLLLPGPSGLVAGFAFGLAVSLVLAWPVPLAVLSRMAAAPRDAYLMTRLAIQQHLGFIRVDVVSVLIAASVLSIYPVIVLIGFGFAEAGIFAVASRRVFIPVEVLAGSISTVYFQRFSLAVRQGEGMMRLFGVTFAAAVAAAAAISLIVLLVADPFVQMFFPPEWAEVSRVMLFLLPTFIARFVIACIGSTPLALSRPKLLFGWNMAQIAIIGITWLVTMNKSLDSFLLIGGSGLLIAGALYLGILSISIRRHECYET